MTSPYFEKPTKRAANSRAPKAPRKTRKLDVEYEEEKEAWRPVHWEEQLKNIEKMRSAKDAPVDTMGCERIADPEMDPPVS